MAISKKEPATAKTKTKKTETTEKTVRKKAIKAPKLGLVESAVAGINEKKGHGIVVLDLRNVKNATSDYFVICHADSTTQIEAIADSVEEQIYKHVGEKPLHKEGQQNAEWILIDYFNVVIHVFQSDKRAYYGLEQLWNDGIQLKLEVGC